MKIGKKTAVLLSGFLWMAVGSMLLFKGFSLLLHEGERAVLLPLMSSSYQEQQQARVWLAVIGLALGFIKGRVVLSKSADRVIRRIQEQAQPISLTTLYPRSYLFLLAGMVLMGIALRWVPIPYDVKGVIDVAIGSALTNGSAFYFRTLVEKKV